MYTDGDFPPAYELADVPEAELHEYIRNGGLTDEAVRDEVHKRHPGLAWIDYLVGESLKNDCRKAGSFLNVLQCASEQTLRLRAAYEAVVADILGDPAPLRARPTITLTEWARIAGVTEGTLKGYVSRGQAPGRLGFDPSTGRAVFDADVARAWIEHRVGRGSRAHKQR